MEVLILVLCGIWIIHALDRVVQFCSSSPKGSWKLRQRIHLIPKWTECLIMNIFGVHSYHPGGYKNFGTDGAALLKCSMSDKVQKPQSNLN